MLALVRQRAVDDHLLAAHPAEVQALLGDQDACGRRSTLGRRPGGLVVALVVVAGADEDPVAGPGLVDGGLDRLELALDPLVGAHPEDAPTLVGRGRRRGDHGER